MIIKDILSENRALEPLELTVINQLKNKESMRLKHAGEMFSDVGSYLSKEQFKCLLGWIMSKNNPVVVKRKEFNPLTGESVVTDYDEHLLEMETLYEGFLTSLITSAMIKAGTKAVIKNADKIAKGQKNIKKLIEPKLSGKPSNNPKLKPDTSTLDGKMEQSQVDKIVKDVAKLVKKDMPTGTSPKIVKGMSKDAVENVLYKSGLSKKQVSQILISSGLKKDKLYKRFLNGMYNGIVKPVGLLVGGGLAGPAAELAVNFKKGEEAWERVKKAHSQRSKTKDLCDDDARKIRTILRNHGWIMSATSRGF